jgi:hypothetical protein
MNVSMLASRPTVDVPGDIYNTELPPRPRVMLADGAIQNLDREVVEGMLSAPDGREKLMPGPSGIMHRTGELLGVSKDLAVWRFGFVEGSEAANAYGCHIPADPETGAIGFLWVLATRRSGKVKETIRDWAVNLPDNFHQVINSPVVITCGEGLISNPIFHPPHTTAVHPVSR